MTTRRSISTAKRLRIWSAHEGVCHLCGLPIRLGEKWHVEHVKPLWLGGEDAEVNMAPAHIDCHAPKTREEAGVRAKNNRVAAKHIGAAAPKQKIQSRGFPTKPRPEKLPLPPRRIYE